MIRVDMEIVRELTCEEFNKHIWYWSPRNPTVACIYNPNEDMWIGLGYGSRETGKFNGVQVFRREDRLKNCIRTDLYENFISTIQGKPDDTPVYKITKEEADSMLMMMELVDDYKLP